MSNDERKQDDRRAAALKSSARKAKRALKKLLTEAGQDPDVVTGWEDGFLKSVTERIDTFGKAFADPEKGNPDQALSWQQGMKLRQIRSSVKRKKAKAASCPV